MAYCPSTKEGLMPNGELWLFKSKKDYEDAYYDMMFDVNNTFELEMPEDY